MKKKRHPFFDLFGDFPDFGEGFEKMREEMKNAVERMQNMNEEDFEKLSKGGPKSKVYGFSINIGPDGKPVVREFGDVHPGKKVEMKPREESRAPLVDVVEGKKFVVVDAEVPGVDKKDIRITAEKNSLEIKVSGKRKYYRKIQFKSTVDPKKMDWTYKNGVLEVKLAVK